MIGPDAGDEEVQLAQLDPNSDWPEVAVPDDLTDFIKRKLNTHWLLVDDDSQGRIVEFNANLADGVVQLELTVNPPLGSRQRAAIRRYTMPLYEQDPEVGPAEQTVAGAITEAAT